MPKKRIDEALSMRLRNEFFADIDSGKLGIREASRALRKSIGMSQAKYAKLIKIAPRSLIDFERGVGNPTLETLEQIGKPFGLELVYRRKRD